MKVLIGGLIFLGVCVVIAVVEYFRGEKKLSFPKWFLWYARNVGRGSGIFLAAWLGKVAPRLVVSTADRLYFYPPTNIVTDAIHELAIIKLENGFTREGYVAESRDCDNAALHDYHYLLNVILPDLCSHIPDAQGKGFACGMFSFQLDGKKARHRVAYITDDQGKKTFIENYEVNDTIIRDVSKTEQSFGVDIV